MMLKQSTAHTFRLGPFVDSTDGNTQENALTIAYTDVLLSKAGGALAAKSDITALTATGANAHYTCVLNATDTGTLGTLRVWCHVAGALPAWKDFLVVPANVYDSLVAGSDLLDANASQVGGTVQTARDLGASVLLSPGVGTGQVSLTAGSLTVGTNNDKTGYSLSSAGVQAIWDVLTSALITAGSIGKMLVDKIVGTLAAGTHSPQSGDAFARLGAPAGASMSADVAAVKTDTGNLVTRITATLFSGITSLAQWLGLMAGKQVGNATARTELRATGAGAGTFDETTDSQEAIRDTAPLGTAMRGTDNAALASVCTAVRLAELDAANLPADVANVKTDTAAILDDTGTSGVVLPQAQADKVWGTVTRVLTANTNLNDPSAAVIADAVWDEAIAGHLGVGSTGAALDGATAPSAAVVADAVWDEILSGHPGAGSTGEALNAAGAAGDPWVTALPGLYGAGSAGKIIGDNLNATISSRSTLDAVGVRTAVGLAAANLDTQLNALPTAAENADAVWDEAATGHVDAGKAGAQLWTDIDAIAVDVAGLNGAAMRGTDNAALASGVVVTTNNDKTGYSIGAGGIPVGAFAAGAINDAATAADMETAIANAVKTIVVESQGSITLQQAISIVLSALAGVTETGGAVLKSPNGLATRITATINASNERTAMTLTPSA